MRLPWMLLVVASVMLTGCAPRQTLSKVYLVDANGFSQTITQRQRLDQIEKINFLSHQPYQKALRTWKDAKTGQTTSVLTSYYASGQLMQCLEGLEGQACGSYREWYENGQMRVQVQVTAGMMDVGPVAEQSWVFDGLSEAWDEKGTLQAQIPYKKGKKEGIAKFYHANSRLWQQLSYHQGLLDGEMLSWYDSGNLLSRASYVKDKPEGLAERFWPDGSVQTQETYQKGKLLQGRYFDASGKLIGETNQGQGQRVVFGKTGPIERQTMVGGEIEGWIGYYDQEGVLWHELHVHKGLKEGEEVYFYPPPVNQEEETSSSHFTRSSLQPKISMQWHENCLRGPVRTWYRHGQLESERQVVQDQTDGPYLAYYPNGQVRMVEEYAAGKLVSGDYFDLHSMTPMSCVRNGNGKALIYNDLGHIEREIIYVDGLPTSTPKPLVDGS